MERSPGRPIPSVVVYGPAPRASVCMPASRSSELLAAAIASVRAQTVDDWELVITDDSGGELADLVAGFDDRRIRYLPNPTRLGFVGNHLRALSLARGRYLAVLHDDDEFTPTYLQRLLEVLDADPSVGVAFCDVTLVEAATGATRRRGLPVAPGRHERFLPVLLAHDFMLPSATVLRADAWRSTAMAWPELTVGDMALFVDLAEAGWPHVYVDEALVRYRVHPGQLTAKEDVFRQAIVEFWEGRRFADPDDEAGRRSKLAGALVALGGTRVKRGDGVGARAHLRRARQLDPSALRTKRRALTAIAALPGTAPLALQAYRRLRPLDPILPGATGTSPAPAAAPEPAGAGAPIAGPVEPPAAQPVRSA